MVKDIYTAKRLVLKNEEIQYYVFGNGKHPLVCLPSFPFSGLYFTRFMELDAATQFKFITLDLPGWSGWSDNTLDQSQKLIPQFIEVISQVIEEEALSKFSVLGYSFGASLAIQIATMFKQQINSLGLVSPVIFGTEDESGRHQLLDFIKFVHAEPLMKTFLVERYKIMMPKVAEHLDPAALNEGTKMLESADSNVLLESARELFNQDLTQSLSGLATEVPIILAGSPQESEMFASQMNKARSILSDSKFIELSGTHNDFILKPTQPAVGELFSSLLPERNSYFW